MILLGVSKLVGMFRARAIKLPRGDHKIMMPIFPAFPSGVVVRKEIRLLCRLIVFFLPLFALQSAAAEPVAIRAKLKVEQGRLQLEWVNPSAEPELIRLYGDDIKLSGLFRERVLLEINDSLKAFNPLTRWKTPIGSDPEQMIGAQLPASETPKAADEFTGPLPAWLSRFAPGEGGRFYDWQPTQPTPPTEDNPDPTDEITESSTKQILTGATSSLIVKIQEDDLVDGGIADEKLVKVRFSVPVAVARVEIGGMDFPVETAGDEEERRQFSGFQNEKRIMEAELSAQASDMRLSWNDDLAVQRLMAVLRARGMWNRFAAGAPGAPRAVHWLAFNETQDVATVYLPHLCYLVFEADADESEKVLKVAQVLLRPAEIEIVKQALQAADAGRTGRPTPEQARLRAIVFRSGARRVVDLFALASYLRDQRTNHRELGYSSLPVREEWLAGGRARIEEMGFIFSSGPAMTSDNRLVPSRGKKRKTFERGGIEVWISPRPKPADEPAAGAPADATSAGAKKQPDADSWFKQQRLRAEFGVSVESSEPVTYKARLSTIDPVVLGQVGLELRYRDRLSGSLDWKPLTKDQQKADLLPSSVSIFTDTPAPREVDGREISLQRDGVRATKRRPWARQIPAGSPVRWMDFSAQIAKVRDLSVAAAPTANEVSASAGFSISAAPNPWDARASRAFRFGATVTGRGEGSLDFWGVLDASAQIRIPRGAWSYFGKFDARWTVGSPAPDALPYLGGIEGVRGMQPYAVPARGVVIVRNELWTPVPFIGRDFGSDQKWYRSAYEVVKPAVFVDVGWASGLHVTGPVRPWFVSPGIGLRLLLGPAHLNIDYAYGITRPTRLGGHHFSLGVTAHY